MGVGIINFVFAIPAFYLIDTFGRRNLLLVTFPFLALFQLLNAVAFELGQKTPGRSHLIIAGLYLFAIAYSPGEGPVPFVCISRSTRLCSKDTDSLTCCRSTLQRACHCTYAISVRSISSHLSNHPY